MGEAVLVPAGWLRLLRAALVGFVVCAAVMLWHTPAFAQNEPDVDMAISQQIEAANLAESVTATNHSPSEVIPPLPFTTPQIGPLIKRSYSDDVNNRTTAYIPQSLDFMTPITMPVTDERWVRVDLSEQVLVAYQGDKLVRAFKISSGLPGTPTVTGEFRIRMKVRSQLMAGGSGSGYYHLPNVEWVQYFYQDYGLHGTYWHNDFGRPKSHGCVNMTNADAKWLYFWLGPTWDGKTVWQRSTEKNPGSLVIVHD